MEITTVVLVFVGGMIALGLLIALRFYVIAILPTIFGLFCAFVLFSHEYEVTGIIFMVAGCFGNFLWAIYWFDVSGSRSKYR
jgi:hypothetical protein